MKAATKPEVTPERLHAPRAPESLGFATTAGLAPLEAPTGQGRRDGGPRVEAVVAGVDPEALDVQVTESAIPTRADTHHRHTGTKGVVHLCEFAPGRPFRSLRLPAPVDLWKAEAVCTNGLLKLTVPLTPRGGEKRTIEIEERPTAEARRGRNVEGVET